MKKLLFILFLIASISMLGQFTFKNGSGTIDVYEYATLKSSMSKTGLEVTYAGAWLRFVQGGKVINRYKFVDVDTPSYSTIDSLVTTIRGWITSTGGDTNLWAISNGHLYPLLDTVVVGGVASPVSRFEVDSLIRFKGDNVQIGNCAVNKTITTGLQNVAIGDKYCLAKITTGGANIAFGHYTLSKCTSGWGNLGVGTSAMELLTTGTYNVGIGTQALNKLVSGTMNTAIGMKAGFYNTGSRNLFMGATTGYSNTGSYNTLLGYASGYNSTGSSNIFIGVYSGYNETGSNRLYIENSNSTTPLIYGEFDNDFIKINGGFAKDYDIKTADYTIGLGDYTIQQQTSSTTVTLPSGTKAGQEYGIVNTSSGTITISTDGTDKLGNTGTSTSYSLASGNAVTVRFDGVDRYTLH